MADLRDLIAETLAAHVDILNRDRSLSCSCGDWLMLAGDAADIIERQAHAHQLHRSDALLAVLDGQLLPPDVEANRQYGRQMPNGLVIASATGETHYRLNGPWVPVEAGQTPGGTGDE